MKNAGRLHLLDSSFMKHFSEILSPEHFSICLIPSLSLSLYLSLLSLFPSLSFSLCFSVLSSCCFNLSLPSLSPSLSLSRFTISLYSLIPQTNLFSINFPILTVFLLMLLVRPSISGCLFGVTNSSIMSGFNFGHIQQISLVMELLLNPNIP